MPIDEKQFRRMLSSLRSAGFLVTYCHEEEERAGDAARASSFFVEDGLISKEDEVELKYILTHSTWQTDPPIGLSAVGDGVSTLTSIRRTEKCEKCGGRRLECKGERGVDLTVCCPDCGHEWSPKI